MTEEKLTSPELLFAKLTDNDKVRCKVDLTKDGIYFKISFDPQGQAIPEDLKQDNWKVQRFLSSKQWTWQQKVEETLGRMHFTDGQFLIYPLVPGYESFARMVKVDTTPATKEITHVSYETQEVDKGLVSRALMTSLSSSLLDKGAARRRFETTFKAELALENATPTPDEVAASTSVPLPAGSVPGAAVSVDGVPVELVDEIYSEVESYLRALVATHAKGSKAKKRVQQKTVEVIEVPQMVFYFKNGLELEMADNAAFAFNLLLPTVERLKERLDLVRYYRNSGVTDEEFDYELKGTMIPFEHQKVMYKIQTTLPKCANLSKMGTGKSFAVAMTIDKRIEKGEVRKGHVLIICPANILETWQKKHLGQGTPHLKSTILTGSYSDRMNTLLEPGDTDIFITNFETFSMKSSMELGGKQIAMPLAAVFALREWDMVVIDEAHKIKNPDAKRTNAIIKVFKDVPYTIIMSGTINANKLYDIHPPFVFLNGAKTFNSLYASRQSSSLPAEAAVKEIFPLSHLYEQFVGAYFQGARKSPKHFTIPELRERMEEISVRYEKDECFDLPEKLYEQRLIDMDPTQKKLYEALRAFLCAELSDLADSGGRVSIMNVLAMMVKLAEAANGWIYDDNHQLINLPTNPKLDALMDYVEDLGDDDKMVVWSRFTNDLHLIYDRLKEVYGEDAVAIIHGGESCPICGSRRADRYEIQERFNDVKSPLRFVVVNTAVGSHGIDLTGATFEAFFSNSFVKTDRSQAEDRCHRHGMRDRLTIVDFVMKETVDIDVLSALKSWKSMTAALLSHLGVDTSKIFSEETAIKTEAPVIVEHVTQRPGECALCAIAMISNTPIDYVRSWINTQIGPGVLYKGTYSQIQLVVDKFIPWMKDAWAGYFAKLEKAKIDQTELSLPPDGTGVAIIRHVKQRNIAHVIAFSNGYVYDPSQFVRSARADYTTWMATNSYTLEAVFPMPADRSLKLPEVNEDGTYKVTE